MTLDVADLGPINRACVELRPLTVFVGPSNTGKSWLATLAYALHRYFRPDPGRWYFRYQIGPEFPEGENDKLVRATNELVVSVPRNVESGAQEAIELPTSVQNAVRLHVEGQGQSIGREVERCFGLDAGRLVRTGSSEPARILLRHAVDGIPVPVEHELSVGDGAWTCRPTVPDRLHLREGLQAGLAELLLTEPEDETERVVQAWQAVNILSRGVLPELHPAFYLPADRTGLMNAHATVVSALIQSATLGGIRRADPVTPLSGVRGDFLEQLVQMVQMSPSQLGRFPRDRRGRDRLRKLSKRIEDRMLGGAVKVGGLPGLSYPHFTYLPRGWKAGLPLASASSMVSELGPVVLYLRHVVSSDDLLIIDEPESHLHPAMQVAFTRHIAAIAGAGVRVLLTTHSEWVLEALGNVVGRAGLPGRGAAGESLDASQVGVWLFEPAGDGDRGSTVREIALDADTGLYPSGFDDVASALHNDWAEIAGRRGDAG